MGEGGEEGESGQRIQNERLAVNDKIASSNMLRFRLAAFVSLCV